MANSPILQSQIDSIAIRAAHEIAAAVRAAVANEVRGLFGAVRSAAPATKASPVASAAPASPGGGARVAAKSGRRRGVEPAVLESTIAWVAKNPGKRTEEIRAALGFDAETGAKVLAKLRATKRLRTEGKTRLTRYFSA